ncbi:MAG: hypothetical protein AAF004_09575 [Pseudomonadota bacterium]
MLVSVLTRVAALSIVVLAGCVTRVDFEDCQNDSAEGRLACDAFIMQTESARRPTSAELVLLGEAHLEMHLASQSNEDNASRRALAKSAYERALIADPNNLDARVALATFLPKEVQGEALKAILDVDPTKRSALLLLWWSLQWSSRDDLSPEEIKTRLVYLRAGYDALPPALREDAASRSGIAVYRAYRSFGAPGQAAAFRRKVLRDIGLYQPDNQDFTGQSLSLRSVSLYCSTYALILDSRVKCLRATQSYLAAHEDVDIPKPDIEILSRGLLRLYPRLRDENNQFVPANMEPLAEMVDASHARDSESEALHRIAFLLADGQEAKLGFIRRASELAGTPLGESAYYLALELLKIGGDAKEEGVALLNALADQESGLYSDLANGRLYQHVMPCNLEKPCEPGISIE